MLEVKYAKVLYSIAKEDNKVSECLQSFKAFIELLEDEEIKAFFVSRVVEAEKKKEVINNSFKGMEELFKFFVYTIIDNHVESSVKEIYDDFVKEYKDDNGIIVAEVYSSYKLDDEEKNSILCSLKKLYENKTIEPVFSLNESIGNGYQIYVNGSQIDLSVKTKVNDLKNTI